MRTATITVTGRVQGVGFRYALQEAARARSVDGWVRNLRDGRVEAFLAGASEAVDGVIAWAHQGPPAARVEEVQVADGGDRPADGFEIRSTA